MQSAAHGIDSAPIKQAYDRPGTLERRPSVQNRDVKRGMTVQRVSFSGSVGSGSFVGFVRAGSFRVWVTCESFVANMRVAGFDGANNVVSFSRHGHSPVPYTWSTASVEACPITRLREKSKKRP